MLGNQKNNERKDSVSGQPSDVGSYLGGSNHPRRDSHEVQYLGGTSALGWSAQLYNDLV